MDRPILFTIGHSTRTIDEFISLLGVNGVTAIADVRSQPYSRHMPHFNRESLQIALKKHGIAYVFLGEELGARRKEKCCYVDGQAKYDLIAKTVSFNSGLKRIREGAKRFSLSLMCSEKDPITCHRTILIARALRDSFSFRHLIDESRVESHLELEKRLVRLWNVHIPDLFATEEELLAQAYEKQADEIAYINRELTSSTKVAGHHD